MIPQSSSFLVYDRVGLYILLCIIPLIFIFFPLSFHTFFRFFSDLSFSYLPSFLSDASMMRKYVWVLQSQALTFARNSGIGI